MGNFFRKLWTKFYLNRTSFVEDITKTFWSLFPETGYSFSTAATYWYDVSQEGSGRTVSSQARKFRYGILSHHTVPLPALPKVHNTVAHLRRWHLFHISLTLPIYGHVSSSALLCRSWSTVDTTALLWSRWSLTKQHECRLVSGEWEKIFSCRHISTKWATST